MISVEFILLALSPIFFVCIFLEFRKARKHYNISDSINNAVLAAFHQGSDAIALFLLMPAFHWLHGYALFDIELNLLTLFIGFLLQDFLYYWFHRASHNIHWFWAAHVVHHSSPYMNFTTAFRQSIMYPVTGMWLFWMPMILVGFEPNLVFAIVALNLGYQFWVHTQSLGKYHRFGKIFNTPDHHCVHHATNAEYIDKNYAGVLIIWDKMFGTFVEKQDDIDIKYGIVGLLPKSNPLDANFHQWQHLFRELGRAKGLKAKWYVLFEYPSHES